MPKSLYKMNSLEEDDEQEAVRTQEGGGSSTLGGNLKHEHQNLYKTVEFRAGYTHEVVIRNKDPKSVLTWDFDVMRSDLHFTLYCTSKVLPVKTGEYFGSYFRYNCFLIKLFLNYF